MSDVGELPKHRDSSLLTDAFEYSKEDSQPNRRVFAPEEARADSLDHPVIGRFKVYCLYPSNWVVTCGNNYDGAIPRVDQENEIC